MQRSFNQYTDAELLTLDNETITDAIHIEAIDRGIKPPIKFSEALRKSEFVGYKLPSEGVTIFQVCVSDDNYSAPTTTGVAYLSEERALSAMDGLVIVDENRYGKGGIKIKPEGRVAIQKTIVGYSSADEKAAKLQAVLEEGNPEFDKVQDECLKRLSDVRQADYDNRVNTEKKTEYLRLSGGDEAIAKSFWAKVERTEWPNTNAE